MSAPPHSLEVEEALLGSMLLSMAAVNAALGAVVAEDFYKPAHAALFQAVRELAEGGLPVDVVTVAEALRTAGKLEEGGGRQALLALVAEVPASANAPGYAQTVVELSARRQLGHAATSIRELAFDQARPLGDVLAGAHESITRAERPLGTERSANVAEFLSRTSEHAWAWPSILEIGDRLIIVAPEKAGKTVMTRQIGVLLSQGIDPFRWHSITPCLVMMIDLENPEQLARRKIGELYDRCNTLEHQAVPETLLLESKREGCYVGVSRSDAIWLEGKIAANVAYWRALNFDASWPLVICIGPLYKMLENELDLPEVRRVQLFLDRMVARYHCALVMETHAPHESFAAGARARSLRPAGPRVWIRWPEFCRAFEQSSVAGAGPGVFDFYDVQGFRDEREWPARLRRGGRFPWGEDPGY